MAMSWWGGAAVAISVAALVAGAPPQASAGEARAYVYVPAESGDALQVVDVDAGRKIKDIAFPGGRITDVESTADGRFVYVLDDGADKMAVIDTRTDSVVKQLDILPNSTRFAVSADGGRAVILAGTTLYALDTGTEQRLLKEDAFDVTALGISPDGTRAYVGKDRLVIYFTLGINGSQGHAAMESGVNSLAVSRTGASVLVGGLDVAILPGDEARKIAGIDIRDNTFPGGLVFADENTALASAAGRLVVINLSGRSSDTLANINLPFGISLLPDQRVVGIRGDGDLVVVGLEDGVIDTEIEIGSGTKAIAAVVVDKASDPAPTSAPITSATPSSAVSTTVSSSGQVSTTSAPTTTVPPRDLPGQHAPSELPVTGANVGWVVVLGLATVAGGAAVVVLAARGGRLRRRRRG